MAGFMALRRAVAPGGTGGAVYAKEIGFSQALVSTVVSAAITKAQYEAGFDLFCVTVDADSYVSVGPVATVSAAVDPRDLIRFGERLEIRGNIGDAVVIVTA